MSNAGLVTMIFAWIIIAFFTTRFFIKVLRTPPKPDGDASSKNDAGTK
jgi:hypothetical protein